MALTDRLHPWAPPAAWCGLILVATSVPVPAEDLPGTDLPLDLVGHGVLYAGLGWTVGRALLRSGRPGAGARIAAWAAGLAFAAADEWHQTFVVTRVPSLGDWTADAVGMTLGLAAVTVFARLRPGADGGRRERPGTAGGGGRKRSTPTGSAAGDAGGSPEAGGEPGAGGDGRGRDSRGRDGRGRDAGRGTSATTDANRREGPLER